MHKLKPTEWQAKIWTIMERFVVLLNMTVMQMQHPLGRKTYISLVSK